MLNTGWIGRPLHTRRVLVFGDTAEARAIGHGRTREVSALQTLDLQADGIVIDTGDEAATLDAARRAAASGVGVIGVVMESWAGFAAALALDNELAGVRVRPLCAPARQARALLVQHPWARLSHQAGPSTALICGTGILAEHLVIALFRSMHLTGQTPQVVVRGDGAAAWVAGLQRRMPQLAGIGSLMAADTAPRLCAAYIVAGAPPALPAAVPQFWFTDQAPPGTVRIAPFDWRHAARVFDDPQDARARAIHSFYYEQALRDGNAPGSRPSMRPWESLPERFRQASRYQADHVPTKLAMIGCRETEQGHGGKCRFTAGEVESLARVEHERWSAVQLLDGWRYGPVRDDAGRITPFLKPFDELTPEIQDRDRMPVRQIPAQLARIGHGVARDVVITVSVEPGAEPGWAFAAGFAALLRDIAARYPGRQPVLATGLATSLEQRAARIALDKHLARLCLLLAGDDPPGDVRPFLPRAARLVVTDGTAVQGSLHLHIGDAPPSTRRLVQIGTNGSVRAAPWL